MMYEGVKRKVFEPAKNEKLYSGGLISNKELQKIQNILKDNSLNNNLPKVIYYLKAFKSFSKKKEKSEDFIKKSSKDSTGLLFELSEYEGNNNNNIEEEFISNADINEFSYFKDSEYEVLFFPFSSFEVLKTGDGEKNGNKYVIIYLKYLGRYKKYIEDHKSSETMLRDIPITEFGRDITKIGLINYKFSKYWEVEKQIPTEKNPNYLLYFEKNKILISIENKLNLYDLEKDKSIYETIIHSKQINDLIKINENTIISSSNDKTIKIIKLTDNFSKLNVIHQIKLHSGEVNQTIKLKKENLYASCSNDKTIQIWKYNPENNIIKQINTISSCKEILTVYELPNYNFISISKDEYLKFYELKEDNYLCLKSLKNFKNPLHNCTFLLNEKTILVGIKKAIYIIDINKKQKIKRFLLNYSAHSIYYINGNIFLGLKNNVNSCLLFEYIIKKEYDEMNLKCIGKGRDLCSEISFILEIDEKTIITCNKSKFIKIWKETLKKPKLLLIENNLDYNFEEGYESEKETPRDVVPEEINEIPGNEDKNNDENVYIKIEEEKVNDSNEKKNEISKENEESESKKNKNIIKKENNENNEKYNKSKTKKKMKKKKKNQKKKKKNLIVRKKMKIKKYS